MSGILTKIAHFKRQAKLKKLRKNGLNFSDDISLMSMPDFGSEPYLVTIGKHVRICSNVKFITHDGSTWVFRQQEEYKHVVRFGKIVIGDNCFIGDNVIIMPNVVIGDNSIIAAGAIVTKDVEPNSVYGGVPAKRIESLDNFIDKCVSELPEYDFEDYHVHNSYWKKQIAEKRFEDSRK